MKLKKFAFIFFGGGGGKAHKVYLSKNFSRKGNEVQTEVLKRLNLSDFVPSPLLVDVLTPFLL